MNTPIEKYCSLFVSSYERQDVQGMNEAANGVYRSIIAGPEMILCADLETVLPLIMIVSEYEMGENAIKMAYYVVLKTFKEAQKQGEKSLIESHVEICIAFMLDNYDSLSHILIAMGQHDANYNLDCQLQAFYRIYCNYISFSKQNYVKNKVEKRCISEWQNPKTADALSESSISDFIENYEYRLKHTEGLWKLSELLDMNLDNL